MTAFNSTPTLADTTSPAVAIRARLAPCVLHPALAQVFPLLLALADDETASASISVARALADCKGAVPTVVRALGDMRAAEVAVSPLAGASLEEFFGPEYASACRDSVEMQLAVAAGPIDWACEITDQSPIDAIVSLAHQLRAGLIVMGLRHHGVLRRAISRDLLSEVLRVTRVPVLAVKADLTSLPKRVVVAIDFGQASLHAAALARHLLAADGSLFLVHVAPVDSNGVRAQLDALLDDLVPAPGMTMSSIVLHGDVQSSIENLAHMVSADLLAVGSARHSLHDRLATASISMKLAHTARWSTLVVPSHQGD